MRPARRGRARASGASPPARLVLVLAGGGCDAARYAAPATRPAAILVTHAHGDHDADTPRLVRFSGAPVVATGDHLEAMKIPEGHYLSINIGGVQKVGDVEIHAVPAMHSVTPGHALGWVLRFADGRTLYDTGDSWVFGDMALIERFFHPTILLFGMGGGRAGEDPRTAAEAIRLCFHPKAIVPMHFGTLPPPFATDADVRAAFRGDRRLRVLVPGQETSFRASASTNLSRRTAARRVAARRAASPRHRGHRGYAPRTTCGSGPRLGRARTNTLGAQGQMVSLYAPQISSRFSVRNLGAPRASVTRFE